MRPTPSPPLFPYTTLFRSMDGMPVEPILVVDDDPSCLCIMTDMLERAGYRVEAANDGTGALARIVDRRYALVVRSEEHTSELQSRENLVCRPQLEKKQLCK